jgi:hypothetical protein
MQCKMKNTYNFTGDDVQKSNFFTVSVLTFYKSNEQVSSPDFRPDSSFLEQ